MNRYVLNRSLLVHESSYDEYEDMIATTTDVDFYLKKGYFDPNSVGLVLMVLSNVLRAEIIIITSEVCNLNHAFFNKGAFFHNT